MIDFSINCVAAEEPAIQISLATAPAFARPVAAEKSTNPPLSGIAAVA